MGVVLNKNVRACNPFTLTSNRSLVEKCCFTAILTLLPSDIFFSCFNNYLIFSKGVFWLFSFLFFSFGGGGGKGIVKIYINNIFNIILKGFKRKMKLYKNNTICFFLQALYHLKQIRTKQTSSHACLCSQTTIKYLSCKNNYISNYICTKSFHRMYMYMFVN